MISSKLTIRLLRVSLFATTCLVPKYESGAEGRETLSRARGQAGALAVDTFVKSGMTVGLGTGNTIFFAVERLGRRVQAGELKDIKVCAVNSVTEHHCSELNIPVISINNISPVQTIDVMIDSADEVDMQLNILKGAKGSLGRERILWDAALQRVIVIGDENKLVKRLGMSAPLSVEVTPWGVQYIKACISVLPSVQGARAILRTGSKTSHYPDGERPPLTHSISHIRHPQRPALTDGGNMVIDIFFDQPIRDAHQLAEELATVPGVVSHGLFIGLATSVVCGSSNLNQKTRVVGHLPEGRAEPIFWGEVPALRPLETETVDNRRI